jgi:Fic family protein
MWEFLATNPAVLVTILILLATTMFTVFAKTIIHIFRMGALFRAEYATKEEQKRFEKEVKSDLRDYKDELLKVVMSASMEMIREKLSDINDIQATANQIKITEKELELKIRNAMEKVDEIRGMADNVRALNQKVDRLVYGQEQAGVRRKEQ